MKKVAQTHKKLSSEDTRKLIMGLTGFKLLTKLRFKVILEEDQEYSYRIVLGLAKYPQLLVSFSLLKDGLR
jgi:hypothetical protein